jgi:hypothetical protein
VCVHTVMYCTVHVLPGIEPGYIVFPRECMEAAKWMLIEAAQKELPLRKMESLMAEKRTRTCVLGVERTLLVVGGCSKRYMKVAYDQE